MGMFIRKPIAVEARRFDPDAPMRQQEELACWCHGSLLGVELRPLRRAIGILVDGEWREVAAGDWIVREPDGTFRGVTAAVFAKTYEPADGHAAGSDQKVA